MMFRILIIVYSIFISACVGPRGFFSDCKSLSAPQEILEQLVDACDGDKMAAYEVGLYFEKRAEQTSKTNDYRQAIGYYEFAAESSNSTSYVYVPGAGSVAGYTMPIQTGIRSSGLAEAQYRLGRLYQSGLGVSKNISKARSLFQKAANQKYPPAIMELNSYRGEC